MSLKNMLSYLNKDIPNIFEFFEIYKALPYTGLLSKIRTSLLAEFSFIINIT